MSGTDDFGRPPYDPSARRGGGRGVAGVEATAETAEFPPIPGAPDGFPGPVDGGRIDEYNDEQPFVPLYEPPAPVGSGVRHAPPPYAGGRPNGMPRGDVPAGMAPARDDRRGPGDPRGLDPRLNDPRMADPRVAEQRPAAEPWDSQSVGASGDDFGARVQPHRQFLRGQDGLPPRRAPERPFPERPFQDRPGPDRPMQDRPMDRPAQERPGMRPPTDSPHRPPQGQAPQPGFAPPGRDHLVPPPRTRNDAPPPARDPRGAPAYPQRPAEPGPGDPRNAAPRRPPMVEPEPDRRGPDSPVRPLHDTAAYRLHRPADSSAAPFDPAVGRPAPQHPEPPIPSQADLSAAEQREQLRRRLPPQEPAPVRDDSTWSANDPEDPDLGPPPVDLVPTAPQEFAAEVRSPARAPEAAAPRSPAGGVGAAAGSFDVFSPRGSNGRRRADAPAAADSAPPEPEGPVVSVPTAPAPAGVPAPAATSDADGGAGPVRTETTGRGLPAAPAERPDVPAPVAGSPRTREDEPRSREDVPRVRDDAAAPAPGTPAFGEVPAAAPDATGTASGAPAGRHVTAVASVMTPAQRPASDAVTAPAAPPLAAPAPAPPEAGPGAVVDRPVAEPVEPAERQDVVVPVPGPAEVGSAEISPAEISPAEVSPAEVSPDVVRSAEVRPTEVRAAEAPAAFEAEADGFDAADDDDEDDADDQMVVPWNNPAARVAEPAEPAAAGAPDAGPRGEAMPQPEPAAHGADPATAGDQQQAEHPAEEPTAHARAETAGTGPSGAAGSRPAHGAPPPELTEPRTAYRAELGQEGSRQPGDTQHLDGAQQPGDTGAYAAPADVESTGPAPEAAPALASPVEPTAPIQTAEPPAAPVAPRPADESDAASQAPADGPSEPAAGPQRSDASRLAPERVAEPVAGRFPAPAVQRQHAVDRPDGAEGTESAGPAVAGEPAGPAAVVEAATQASVAPRNVTAHAVGEQVSAEPGRGRRAVRRAEETAPATSGRAPAYAAADRDAVYRVIRERRDIGNDFLCDDIPDDVLTRVLESAHTAPSVGFAQPWDFIVLRSAEVRESVRELALRQRKEREAAVPRRRRAKSDAASDADAIVRAPVSVVVTCDPTRGGRGSGTDDQARRAPYLAALAVENLWLAARAEGLGVDWLSFPDEREFAELLDLPDHLEIVAYLCLGYVREFTPASPALPESAEWGRRRPLAWAVHEEQYGRRALPGDEPMSLLAETTQAIRPLDAEAVARARQRHERLEKPRGSLGVLEAVTEQIAGLTAICPPLVPEPAAIAIFAGDHGVHAQGVAPRPQDATARGVVSVLEGRGVVSAFAAQLGVDICVVDVGVATDLPEHEGLVPRKVRYGTGDFTEGAAMTRSEAVEAIEAGIETARDLVAAGNRCLLTGDLGVANSTVSAALLAAFTKASASQVTGYGTGIDEQAYAHKVDVVSHALRTHQPDPEDPVGVLAAVGGLEHAAIAGFVLGAAALRVPLILDGVTACSAALAAQALCPEAITACVAGHRSAEPGHALALEALGVTPLADIELHTGEGAGAVLALPLVQSAVRALRDVALAEDDAAADGSQDVAANGAEER